MSHTRAWTWRILLFIYLPLLIVGMVRVAWQLGEMMKADVAVAQHNQEAGK